MSRMEQSALAALIDAARERNGWSDEDVARKARTLGHKLSKTEVSNYRLAGMQTLVPDKIRGLADGLELPPWKVVVAALEDHGMRFPIDRATPEDVIAADETLPATDKETMRILLERARDRTNPRPARRRRATFNEGHP